MPPLVHWPIQPINAISHCITSIMMILNTWLIMNIDNQIWSMPRLNKFVRSSPPYKFNSILLKEADKDWLENAREKVFCLPFQIFNNSELRIHQSSSNDVKYQEFMKISLISKINLRSKKYSKFWWYAIKPI